MDDPIDAWWAARYERYEMALEWLKSDFFISSMHLSAPDRTALCIDIYRRRKAYGHWTLDHRPGSDQVDVRHHIPISYLPDGLFAEFHPHLEASFDLESWHSNEQGCLAYFLGTRIASKVAGLLESGQLDEQLAQLLAGGGR